MHHHKRLPNPFTDQAYVNISGKCAEMELLFLEDLMGRAGYKSSKRIGQSYNTGHHCHSPVNTWCIW
ncbi:MAG: hypothetical protein IPP37_03175 [Saprospiraceae bacterium]|nr:hypothetical protein [Saprospiraceae bacterium]